jgi:hypothetical protein
MTGTLGDVEVEVDLVRRSVKTLAGTCFLIWNVSACNVSRQQFALEPPVSLPEMRLKNLDADFLAKLDTVTRTDGPVMPIATLRFLHDYEKK